MVWRKLTGMLRADRVELKKREDCANSDVVDKEGE
jgi:hypothetical protein